MSDRFASHMPSLTRPASSGFQVVANDAVDLPEMTRALYVGTGGGVDVTMLSGERLTFHAVSDEYFLLLRVSRLNASGTTAENIVALV